MRTNSLQRSKAGRTRIIVVCIGLFICGALFFFSKPLGATVSYLAYPLFTAHAWFIASDMPLASALRSRASLAEENKSLKNELSDTKRDVLRLAVLEEENRHMRGLEHEGTDRIVAGIVRRPNETPYDTLVVSAGSRNGVKEGALVFAGQTVVGTVARVFPLSALVVLFSTPGVITPVYVYGADVFARAEGMGGGVIRVGAPQGVALEVGDPVVVPVGESGVYGIIEYIESDASNPEQYAYVAGRQPIATVRYVAIDREPVPTLSFEEIERTVDALRTPGHATSSLEALIEVVPTASTTGTTSPANP